MSNFVLSWVTKYNQSATYVSMAHSEFFFPTQNFKDLCKLESLAKREIYNFLFCAQIACRFNLAYKEITQNA